MQEAIDTRFVVGSRSARVRVPNGEADYGTQRESGTEYFEAVRVVRRSAVAKGRGPRSRFRKNERARRDDDDDGDVFVRRDGWSRARKLSGRGKDGEKV